MVFHPNFTIISSQANEEADYHLQRCFMANFHNVICTMDLSTHAWAPIDEMASQCGTVGICEYAVEEAQIDDLLGRRAFTGGEVEESIYNEIDAHFGSSNKRLYSFNSTDFEKIALFTEALRGDFPDVHYQIEEVSGDEDFWNSEWKKNYCAIAIKPDFYIVPSWEEVIPNALSVKIYPGRGFGTGSHETTKMCLEFFYENSSSEIKTILDHGCGSGILGIAAIKLQEKKYNQTSSVNFCDIDRQALDNTFQNIELNFKSDGALTGSSLTIRPKLNLEAKYDLIFANILHYALIEESDVLAGLAKSGTKLILSGLLNDQAASIVSHYQTKGFRFIEEKKMNDWSALLMIKE